MVNVRILFMGNVLGETEISYNTIPLIEKDGFIVEII